MAAAAGLVLLSPLIAVIAIAIRLDDRGPVYYSQARVGKGFRVFYLYKFRSMVVDSDRGGLLTMRDDTRQTRVGKILRKLKLDELPQLYNVLKGDMQLIGPRPEVSKYVEQFRPEYEKLLRDRPGITDPASVVYRREAELFNVGNLDEQYATKILPNKLRLSLAYQDNRSFLRDLLILVQTVCPFMSFYRQL
jgi:lipopolysaccharide/colanic/teichoic acid biosynthesis glycosyltransferase